MAGEPDGYHAACPVISPGISDGRFRHEVLAVVLQVRPAGLQVLLWQRAEPPFEGRWALPGGPLGGDERLGTSLGRHLAAKVDLTDIAHLEQLETRSPTPSATPAGGSWPRPTWPWSPPTHDPQLPPDTAWHPVDELPPTAFDHASIVGSARDRLRAKLSYTNIGFALAPDDVHHRRAPGHLRRLGGPPHLGHQPAAHPDPPRRHRADRGGRPPHLGRRGPPPCTASLQRHLVVTNPFAAFRPPAEPPAG